MAAELAQVSALQEQLLRTTEDMLSMRMHALDAVLAQVRARQEQSSRHNRIIADHEERCRKAALFYNAVGASNAKYFMYTSDPAF